MRTEFDRVARVAGRAFLVLILSLIAPGCWNTDCDHERVKGGGGGGGGGGSTTLELCPPVDIVFIMDTSGSMDDDAAELCDRIAGVEAELRALGLDEIRTTLLGIVNTPTISEPGAADGAPAPGTGFDCLTNTVYRVAGGDGTNHPVVPGSPPPAQTVETSPGVFNFVDPTILDPGNNESEEFWAPATALIAAGFAWLPDPGTGPGTLRIVVPISDESPQTGRSRCFEVDDLAVANANSVAVLNDVLVSPILGTSSDRDPCIGDLMQAMATATGGTFTDSNLDPDFDLAEAIFDLVLDACERVTVPRTE